MAKSTTATMTQMGPSRVPSSLHSTSTAAANDFVESPRLPIPHPEEPLLYQIPTDVFPSYRTLPLATRLIVFFLSLGTSAVTTWERLTWLQPLTILQGWKKLPSPFELLTFISKTILLTVFVQTILQDIFARPSRLPIETLMKKYFLPSPLSKYKSITVPNGGMNENSATLGVHFLEYYYTNNNNKKKKNVSTSTNNNFDAIYMNHGFGASSLSWLPVIPSLTKRLGSKACYGHDAPGFGFTDRPKDLDLYTTTGSATIAKTLLLEKIGSEQPKSIALFGHSLGAITTLKMALQLPKETSKIIVLCAPALGLRRSSGSSSTSSSPSRKEKMQSVLSMVWKPFGTTIRKGFMYPVGGYVLRRVVG